MNGWVDITEEEYWSMVEKVRPLQDRIVELVGEVARLKDQIAAAQKVVEVYYGKTGLPVEEMDALRAALEAAQKP